MEAEINFRIRSLPQTELRSIVEECGAYEAELNAEMKTLQAVVDCSGSSSAPPVNDAWPLSYPSLSAVLGRFPNEYNLDYNMPVPTTFPKATADTTITQTQSLTYPFLLEVFKKVSLIEWGSIFKKPVTSKDAPGYDERIFFPMDLSLIRKMIVTDLITSLSDFRDALSLMCYNCLKYNGRDSDYADFTQNFENECDTILEEATREAYKYIRGTGNASIGGSTGSPSNPSPGSAGASPNQVAGAGAATGTNVKVEKMDVGTENVKVEGAAAKPPTTAAGGNTEVTKDVKVEGKGEGEEGGEGGEGGDKEKGGDEGEDQNDGDGEGGCDGGEEKEDGEGEGDEKEGEEERASRKRTSRSVSPPPRASKRRK
ncbi:hypothetical protein TrST_g9888 [Triparma strigata]|uniref:Bromo domain-containing protein n=1 Tax=Triparma strigata TaxID=1606541 RepID=A0A9W7A3R4_9STRA|nr:hypothetical protein TrST_g9888 [Triparma strigata]